MSTPLNQSLSDWLFTKSSPYFRPQTKDLAPVKIAKFSAELTTFSLITAAALIETVFRHAVFCMVKSIQFFIPKVYAKNFNEKILFPALHLAKSSLATSGKCLVRLFRKSQTFQYFANQRIDIALDQFYFHSKTMNAIANFHFNGISEISFSSIHKKPVLERIWKRLLTSETLKKAYFSPVGQAISKNSLAWKVFKRLCLS